MLLLSLAGMLAFTAAGTDCQGQSLSVKSLECEYKVNPLGIEAKKPRLSWKIVSNERGVMQSAYRIRTAANIDDLESGRNLLWDSGKVESDRSIHIPYDGDNLESRQRVYWQVRVWDNKGDVSGWSKPAWWEMGLLEPDDWKAEWIEPELEEDENSSNPCPMLRNQFKLKKNIKSARAYITCHGLYEMQINGKKVGDQVFTPGWTSYHKTLQYQVYNVTDMLKAGNNCAGVILGDGWYRGNLAWGDNKYGKKLGLLVQIEVTYKDGSTEIITSDESWKASTGAILVSDIYNGELYDARLEKEGWSEPGYDDSGWSSVTETDYNKDILTASVGEPVKKIETVEPVEIITTPEGNTVVDMGQNMVGWVRFKVKGEPGTRIRLRHAEVLDAEGNFYTENLRDAKQTVEYILKGEGEEVYEPHFTFQGFRYVCVENWPGELSLDDLTGIVIHSDIEPTGEFECSSDMINQLQHNIRWGQKGNFLDVPTDCPQRDERLGWTGDAQVFAPTACFNYDVAAFYTKWLADLSADQHSSGAVPHVIPDVLGGGNAAAAGWADASVIIPWTVYLYYGDKRILQKQYESMKGWVDYMADRAGDNYLWENDYTFGDWLAFSTDRSDYPGATTSKDFIRQAYFAHSTRLFVRISKILDKKDDTKKYSKLLANIKKAFRNEFVTPNGRVTSDTQTAYSLTVAFDLLSEKEAVAAERLAENVERFGHITTGFLGTPAICHALSENNYLGQAYMLLNRKEYPSWLYPVTRGATTIWERWDGIKPDGSFQNPGMNSFNHYAYGAIGDWLYRTVAGIKPDKDSPGFKHIIIHPHPGGGLKWARAKLNSMYGHIEAGWDMDGEKTFTVEIPPNTTATIKLPSTKINDLRENGTPLSKSDGIIKISQQSDTAVIQAGSGRYTFSSR